MVVKRCLENALAFSALYNRIIPKSFMAFRKLHVCGTALAASVLLLLFYLFWSRIIKSEV
jgi:hypothetical protein